MKLTELKMYTEFITFDLYSFGIFSFHIYRASVIQQLEILFFFRDLIRQTGHQQTNSDSLGYSSLLNPPSIISSPLLL